ncbi:hypothetical protein OG205_34880 [Lentzea sp. NBC_00516]|uniref:Clp protease N-terminal domain-containing protein n=1 Tax=Lentzea sp. NBC_00516 TaxID=2903582 RepID=UPI002E817B26|nr:Clp protease N-terminal domain-containing protein [Lentzea sp. NBC_00516]WUD23210.1 hypothetical protein OG205_34880 [Lentzea sp. NBC_00516]
MMIAERFTKEAREAVKTAVREAEEGHAAEVGVEHLLLAVLDAPVLAGFDLPRAELETAFQDYRRKGGLTKADAEALRGLGIDVDAVIDSVEQSLGTGCSGPVHAGGGSGCRWSRPARRRWRTRCVSRATSATISWVWNTSCWRCCRARESWPRC